MRKVIADPYLKELEEDLATDEELCRRTLAPSKNRVQIGSPLDIDDAPCHTDATDEVEFRQGTAEMEPEQREGEVEDTEVVLDEDTSKQHHLRLDFGKVHAFALASLSTPAEKQRTLYDLIRIHPELTARELQANTREGSVQQEARRVLDSIL